MLVLFIYHFVFCIGLDLDCGPHLAVYTEGAIKQGKLREVDVDGALVNTIAVQMRLGMFDGPRQPYANLGIRDVCLGSSNQLALEAARQGIVLLGNRGHGPPLSAVQHRTVAVIGPNSDVTVTMIGNYAGTEYINKKLNPIQSKIIIIFLIIIYRNRLRLYNTITRYI